MYSAFEKSLVCMWGGTMGWGMDRSLGRDESPRAPI